MENVKPEYVETSINIGIDKLKWLYMDARERMLPESEAIQNNLTESFWETLIEKINHRQLINVAVRGEVRTGKSTVVIKIAYEINRYMAKIGLNSNVLKKMSSYIFSDQTEFLRFVNGEDRNVALAIDEFNSLAKTGLNATTEEALFDYYSDVFAAQYQHRITASPDVITDKNATYILDVIGRDEKTNFVRCKLIYRDIITKQSMCIGHVNIFVGDIIHNWINNVRKILEERGVKSLNDQKEVDKWGEEDFYVKYQIKKYRRMDLLKKHGVRDIRELEYANIILEVVQELQEHAKVEKIEQEMIILTVDEVRRRHKRIYTMLVLNEIGQKARGLLSILTKINRLYKKLRNKKLIPEEEIVFKSSVAQLKDMLKKRTEEQQELADLYKQYLNIR